MNLVVSIITVVPAVIAGWLFLYPTVAHALVAELKRRWRLYLIKRYGNIEFQNFAGRFRKQVACKDYQKSDIEALLSQRKDIIVERLGKKAVNMKLGEPTPLERYF